MIKKNNLSNSVLFWFTLILIIVFFYPKPCQMLPRPENIVYSCTGINNVFKTNVSSTDLALNKTFYRTQYWCSGICIEKSKVTNARVNWTNDSNSPMEIKEVTSGFADILPKLFLILIIIALITVIVKFKKSKTNTTVIKG